MPGLRHKTLRCFRMLSDLDKFERILLLVIIAGAILRIATLWTQQPRYDGTAYMAEANSLAQGMGFTGPWGRYDDPFSSTPQPTNLGPIYPLYLSVFYRIAGFSIGVTQVAGILLGFLVLALAYFAGRNLYGRFAGLLTCAVLSANPLLIMFPGWEQADNLPVLFAIVTLWGLIHGIRQQKWLGFLVAGLGAALFALTKAQGLGLGVALSAAAGFAVWRLLESGRQALIERRTWTFIAAFLAPLLPWFAWGPHPGPPPPLASPSTVDVLLAVGVKFLFVVYGLAFTLAFLLPEIAGARRVWHAEEGRVLWLSGLGLSGIVWLLLVADYAAGNVPGPLWRSEQARHLVPALVPFVWLVSLPRGARTYTDGKKWIPRRSARWLISVVLLSAIPAAVWFGTFLDGLFLLFLSIAVHVRPTRQRMTLFLALSLLVAANSAFDVHRSPEDNAGLWLHAHVRPGDVVAIDPWMAAANGTASSDGPIYKYELYPYLGDKNVSVTPYKPGINATFILSWQSSNFTGYRLVGAYGWESHPGPLGLAWEWVLNTARAATGRSAQEAPPTPSAWLSERVS